MSLHGPKCSTRDSVGLQLCRQSRWYCLSHPFPTLLTIPLVLPLTPFPNFSSVGAHGCRAYNPVPCFWALYYWQPPSTELFYSDIRRGVHENLQSPRTDSHVTTSIDRRVEDSSVVAFLSDVLQPAKPEGEFTVVVSRLGSLHRRLSSACKLYV